MNIPSDLKERVIELLSENKMLTTSAIGRRLRISYYKALKLLSMMASDGIVKMVPIGDYNTFWKLNDKFKEKLEREKDG